MSGHHCEWKENIFRKHNQWVFECGRDEGDGAM